MDFAAIVRKTWDENLLFSVLIELTYRCNLDCFYCYNDLQLAGRPLDVRQYETLLQELAALQVFNLVLSGGEPLAHPEFFTLGAKARELGFVVRVKSNGHALRGPLARRLRDEVDPFLVETSLHGAQAVTHDRQTRVPGSFDRLLRNLREAQDIGLRIKINCTLTAWNEDEIEGMMALATDLGLPLHIDPVVTPRDDGDTSPLQIAPSRQGVERLLRLQREAGAAAAAESEENRSREAASALTVGRQADALLPAPGPKKHCGAGSGGLAIDPYGNVYPCVQWRQPVGNLHQQTIREIWEGSAALVTVRQQTEDVKAMIDQQGSWGQALNFCPGSAQQETGSPLGIYDSARRRADVAEELRQDKPHRSLPIVS